MWRCVSAVQRAACGLRALSSAAADMEQALGKLQTNPYYDKYASRIAELQRARPEEFERRARIVVPKPRAAAAAAAEAAQPELGQYAALLQPKAAVAAPAPPPPRRLADIMRVELLADKSAQEVAALWQQYHVTQPAALAAVVPWAAHARAALCAQHHPTFVVPLPRQHGYEFFLLQTVADTVHYTPLLAYQVHGENAPECLTLTYYTELRERGIVLMRGEYDTKVLSASEARCLVNQFQLYYGGEEGGGGDERRRLLQQFTSEPDAFQHMQLIHQLENISLDAPAPAPAPDPDPSASHTQ